MFDLFTDGARAAVVASQEEARRLGAQWIGADHLMLAALGAAPDALTAGLAGLGLTPASWGAAMSGSAPDPGLRSPDAEALGTLGIDLDAVRARVEAQFGPGTLADPEPAPTAFIPFGPGAKQALEGAVAAAGELGDAGIDVGHVVLGLLEPAGDLLAGLELRPEAVRAAVLRARAA